MLSLARNEYKAAKTEAGQKQTLLLASGLLRQMERKYDKNQIATGVSDWHDEYTLTSQLEGRQAWRTGVYGKIPEIVWLVAESRSDTDFSSVERGYFTPPGGSKLLAYQQALYAGQGIEIADQYVSAPAFLSGGRVLTEGTLVPDRSFQIRPLVEPAWTAYTRGVDLPSEAYWQSGGLESQIYNGFLRTPSKTARFYPERTIAGNGVFVNPFSIDIGEGVVFPGQVVMISRGGIVIRDHAQLSCAFLYAQGGITFGNQVTFAGVAVTPAAITVGEGCRITWNAAALQTVRTPILMKGRELIFWN